MKMEKIDGIELMRDYPVEQFVDEIADTPLAEAMTACDMRHQLGGEMPVWEASTPPAIPTERFSPELAELERRSWSKLSSEDRTHMRELQKQLNDMPEFQLAMKNYRKAHAVYLAARERRASFQRAHALASIIKPLEQGMARERRNLHKTKEVDEAAALGIDVPTYQHKKRETRKATQKTAANSALVQNVKNARRKAAEMAEMDTRAIF